MKRQPAHWVMMPQLPGGESLRWGERGQRWREGREERKKRWRKENRARSWKETVLNGYEILKDREKSGTTCDASPKVTWWQATVRPEFRGWDWTAPEARLDFQKKSSLFTPSVRSEELNANWLGIIGHVPASPICRAKSRKSQKA